MKDTVGVVKGDTVGSSPGSHRQDLLAGSSQQDGAGFGVFALGDEGEVLVPDLLDLEQPRPRAHVLLTQLVGPTGDTSAARPDSHRERVQACCQLIGSETVTAAYLAMRLLSVFLTRRMAVMFAFIR